MNTRGPIPIVREKTDMIPDHAQSSNAVMPKTNAWDVALWIGGAVVFVLLLMLIQWVLGLIAYNAVNAYDKRFYAAMRYFIILLLVASPFIVIIMGVAQGIVRIRMAKVINATHAPMHVKNIESGAYDKQMVQYAMQALVEAAKVSMYGSAQMLTIDNSTASHTLTNKDAKDAEGDLPLGTLIDIDSDDKG